jgi:hypothetical protein
LNVPISIVSVPLGLSRLTGGAVLLAAFVAWELRVENPMLPMGFFCNRAFTLANAASMFMFFGMFGAIFLVSQFFQTVQGPFILAGVGMALFVAPVANVVLPAVRPAEE